MTFNTPEGARREAQESASVKHNPDDRLPKDRSKRSPSKSEVERRKEQSRHALLSRDDIELDYNLTRRWLELAALTGDGPRWSASPAGWSGISAARSRTGWPPGRSAALLSRWRPRDR